MRSSKAVITAFVCMTLLSAALGAQTVLAQELERPDVDVEKGTTPVVREKIIGDTPLTGERASPDTRDNQLEQSMPDLMLGPCEVLCDRGGGYSKDVCTQYGYSNQFMYKVGAPMKNVGEVSADFQESWRMWEVTDLDGMKVNEPLWVAQLEVAPRGGVSLTAGAQMPEARGPALYNLVLSPGKHSVTFSADPEKRIPERLENNNTSKCVWEVANTAPEAPFDLAITELGISPEEGQEGEDFSFTVTVKNLGEHLFDLINVTCMPGVGFFLPGIEADEEITTTYLIPGTFNPGTKTVLCTVHSPNYSERDTSNNSMTAIFTVTPLSGE